MKKENMIYSCVDCAVTNCNDEKTMYPDFCPTARLLKQTEAAVDTARNVPGSDDGAEFETGIDEVLSLYIEDEGNSKVMKAAAEVEYENYCRMTRIEEIAEFAGKIGARRLGVATCVGLIAESRAAAKFFRHKGFEVYGIACKVGAQSKTSVGIDPCCQAVGKNMCNPIMQAKLLNEKKTDLNIVVGLCVGHDSMFYKYSDALCTTLITKDRVLGHNPVAAIYQMKAYYSKLMK